MISIDPLSHILVTVAAESLTSSSHSQEWLVWLFTFMDRTLETLFPSLPL